MEVYVWVWDYTRGLGTVKGSLAIGESEYVTIQGVLVQNFSGGCTEYGTIREWDCTGRSRYGTIQTGLYRCLGTGPFTYWWSLAPWLALHEFG